MIPLEGFRYLARGFIIPVEGLVSDILSGVYDKIVEI